MPDINWNGDASTAPYISRYDQVNDNLVLAETNAGTVLLEYDGTQWQATDLDVAQLEADTGQFSTSLTDAGAITHTRGIADRDAIQVAPGDSIQSAIDAAADADARRSGKVILTKDPSGNGFFTASDADTLPIRVKNGVTLEASGVWVDEGTSTASSVFSVAPNAQIVAPGGQFSVSSSVGAFFEFDGDVEAIATQDQTAIMGYPRVQTPTGTPMLRLSQSTGNSVAGAYAELTGWNCGGGVEFISSDANGFINGNRVNITGNFESGDVAVFDSTGGGTDLTLNVVSTAGTVNILPNVDEVARFEGAPTKNNVLRGTLFDVNNATTPWFWGANCGKENKVVRRFDTVAPGTNNSGDATNEAIADMAL